MLDNGLAMAAVSVLLPPGVVAYPRFVADHVMAFLGGALSGVPGGPGPFEGLMTRLLPPMDTAGLAVAFLDFIWRRDLNVRRSGPNNRSLLILAGQQRRRKEKTGETTMRLATSKAPFENLALGAALERWLRPAVGFEHPTDVLKDPMLDITEKRAILSSWASDASAVQDEPSLRWLLGTPSPVPFFEVRDAMDRLDRVEAKAKRGVSLDYLSGSSLLLC